MSSKIFNLFHPLPLAWYYYPHTSTIISKLYLFIYNTSTSSSLLFCLIFSKLCYINVGYKLNLCLKFYYRHEFEVNV